jgi:hypothetical protein
LTPEPVPGLRSFKLRWRDARVRVVPLRGLDGAPFTGPGVDLLGDDAARAFALAAPMEAWLRAREPGLTLRSLGTDLVQGRVLVSFDDPHGVTEKPVALRIVAPDSSALLDAAQELVAFLERMARDRLTKRV